jgi:hypothetical protein
MSFDLGSLDTKKACDAGAVLELRHPDTGKGLGIFITLAGVDSEAYVKASNRIAARRANLNMTPARMKKVRAGRPVDVTEEDIGAQQDDGIQLLAAVTLSWEGVLVDGNEVACGQEQAVSLYSRFPWIRQQVDEWVSERANFLAGSPGS